MTSIAAPVAADIAAIQQQVIDLELLGKPTAPTLEILEEKLIQLVGDEDIYYEIIFGRLLPNQHNRLIHELVRATTKFIEESREKHDLINASLHKQIILTFITCLKLDTLAPQLTEVQLSYVESFLDIKTDDLNLSASTKKVLQIGLATLDTLYMGKVNLQDVLTNLPALLSQLEMPDHLTSETKMKATDSPNDENDSILAFLSPFLVYPVAANDTPPYERIAWWKIIFSCLDLRC